MRKLVLLMGVLALVALVPLAAADVQDVQETGLRVDAGLAGEVASHCAESTRSSEPRVSAETCTEMIPLCLVVFAYIHKDPFSVEPEVNLDCPNEWVAFAWEFVWSLL